MKPFRFITVLSLLMTAIPAWSVSSSPEASAPSPPPAATVPIPVLPRVGEVTLPDGTKGTPAEILATLQRQNQMIQELQQALQQSRAEALRAATDAERWQATVQQLVALFGGPVPSIRTSPASLPRSATPVPKR